MARRFLRAVRSGQPAALALAGVVAVVAVTAIGAVLARGRSSSTPEGPLPAFEATAVDGAAVHSADFAGRPLFVNAWASWCIPCREETPGVRRLYEAYGDRVQFLGLNVRDGREPALAYVDDLGIDYPIAFDGGDAAYDALRISGVPTSLFVNSEGVIVRRVVGPMTEQELARYLDEIAE